MIATGDLKSDIQYLYSACYHLCQSVQLSFYLLPGTIMGERPGHLYEGKKKQDDFIVLLHPV